MPTSANEIILGFRNRYFEQYGKEFYVNSWHVTLAGRVGKYYTPGQVKKTLDFYFKYYGRHSINDFCDHIDDIMKERELTEQSEKNVDALVEETKRRMKKIYEY